MISRVQKYKIRLAIEKKAAFFGAASILLGEIFAAAIKKMRVIDL